MSMGTAAHDPARESGETARIEAFSDGVFAIAITLLVLDLKVPRDASDGTGLLRALLGQWPAYLAFLTSFATIGIMWVNHHRLFTLIRRSNHTLLLLNSLLLLGITFVPFPTALVAAYVLRHGDRVAALVYSGTFTVIAVVFNLLWRYACHGHRLLRPNVDPAVVQAITRAYAFGPPLYLLSFGLAWVNVPASLAMNVALALFFALPDRRR
ncbi:MAG TPA: TMEM175 family protein [bacterium]|nr:TMEM175 family protein [bacterium]